MREILFRGQTRRKGEKVNMRGQPIPGNWVYGGIFPQTNGGSYSIIYTYEPLDKWPVYAETVGQYTGLMDRRFQRIFEGDVIRHYNDRSNTSAFAVGVVYWEQSDCSFKQKDVGTGRVYTLSPTCNYEVIGNIYDNPELARRSGNDPE